MVLLPRKVPSSSTQLWLPSGSMPCGQHRERKPDRVCARVRVPVPVRVCSPSRFRLATNKLAGMIAAGRADAGLRDQRALHHGHSHNHTAALRVPSPASSWWAEPEQSPPPAARHLRREGRKEVVGSGGHKVAQSHACQANMCMTAVTACCAQLALEHMGRIMIGLADVSQHVTPHQLSLSHTSCAACSPPPPPRGAHLCCSSRGHP